MNAVLLLSLINEAFWKYNTDEKWGVRNEMGEIQGLARVKTKHTIQQS